MDVNGLADHMMDSEALDVDEEDVAELRSHLSEKTLDMLLDQVVEVIEDELDETMDTTMREYVRLLLIEFSGEVSRRVEKQREEL